MEVQDWKCELKPKQAKKKRDVSKVNVGLERLCHHANNPTGAYYCIPQDPIIVSPQSKFELIEYITDTSENIIFISAPLTKEEVAILDEVHQQHTYLSAKEHNTLLDTLLEEKGRSKIICVALSPGKKLR